VLHGIGGVGKSALAGRAMARLAEDGWICAAIAGKFNVDSLARACAAALKRGTRAELASLADRLGDSRADDQQRLSVLMHLLQSQPLLLVLDNFESNLDVGGAAYLDPSVGDWLHRLCERARRGRLLLTSRHPPPASGDWLEPIALGPLSPAQTRKLILRLPGLQRLEADELREIQRRVGGHPRMLEYLDAILRRGRARLPRIAQRLREDARAAGVSLQAENASLDEAIRKTLLVGAHDVLLAALASLAREAGDEEVLLQAAASNLPIDCAGVAHALEQRQPSAMEASRARHSLERLAELSLVTFLTPDTVFVHRWTAECLLNQAPEDARKRFFRGAGLWRWWRVQALTHAVADAMEAVDNLLQAQEFDQASEIALGIAQALVDDRQSAVAAGFAADVRQGLGTDHPNYAPLADIEATSLIASGFTPRGVARHRALLAIREQRAQAEPERADYQRDLVVSLFRIAAIDSTKSAACLQQALAILRGLATSGREAPGLDAMIQYCEQALGPR